MLILLPPSEGKSGPRRGKALELGALVFAEELAPAREAVLLALEKVCAGPVENAAAVLDLTPNQFDEVLRNRGLRAAPTAAAERIYTGVLYDHLGLTELAPHARRRAQRSVLISSGLWGMLRPGDRIPAYRLSGAVSLPGLGTLAGHWRAPLAAVLPERIGRGLLLDLRSGTYAAAWRPPAALAARTVTVTVTQQGRVVSHHNKATKGVLARALLDAGVDARNPANLLAACRDLGFPAHLDAPSARGCTLRIDTPGT
ncbi:MAG: YaaA family protein [Sporichthyaceae bacterium]